jgi:hypothetical protein
MKRKIIDAEKAAPEIAREAVERARACVLSSVTPKMRLRMNVFLREKKLAKRERIVATIKPPLRSASRFQM